MSLPQDAKLKEVLDSREAEYGGALENFERIGRIWAALLDINNIEPYQVALMMDALKTVRLFNNPTHDDSWVDKLGYIHHAVEIVKK